MVKVKYKDDTKLERYLPVQWASYFAIPLGCLFRQWSCYEVRSTMALVCSFPRRSYFNYVVEASDLNGNRASSSLGIGQYFVRDLPGLVDVSYGFSVKELPFVSIKPVTSRESIVTLLKGKRKIDIRVRDGYPYDSSFFMLRGKYYYSLRARFWS